MDELIQTVVKQLGLSESLARNATGLVVKFLKDGLGDGFSAVSDKLPGVDDLINSAQAAPSASGGGGIMGSVIKAATSVLGSGAGKGFELVESLGKTGLTTEQSGSVVSTVLNFIKGQVGDDFLRLVAEKLPALKPFIA